MKKIIQSLFIFIGFMMAASCSSDENTEEVQRTTPQTFVKKMTVKVSNGGSEQDLTGIFEFKYNENRELVEIEKNVYNSAGLFETHIYSYTYNNGRIINYTSPNGFRTVNYDANDNILNIGNGSDMEYDSNHNMTKDYFGNLFSYVNNNQTQMNNGVLYSYDDKKNPFLNHNRYFKLLFDFEFEMYGSHVNFVSVNNILTEESSIEWQDFTHHMQYDENQFPIKITNVDANGTTTEELLFEYVDL